MAYIMKKNEFRNESLKNIDNNQMNNNIKKNKIWQKPVLVELDLKCTRGGGQGTAEDTNGGGFLF